MLDGQEVHVFVEPEEFGIFDVVYRLRMVPRNEYIETVEQYHSKEAIDELKKDAVVGFSELSFKIWDIPQRAE